MNGYDDGSVPLWACACGTTLCASPGEILDCCTDRGVRGICVLCDEPIERPDAWVPLNPAQLAHHECSMREVLGGIGHQIAHDYWCVQQRDTDAGFTRRQSAQLVLALIDVIGIEAVSKRSVV